MEYVVGLLGGLLIALVIFCACFCPLPHARLFDPFPKTRRTDRNEA